MKENALQDTKKENGKRVTSEEKKKTENMKVKIRAPKKENWKTEDNISKANE